MNPEIAQAEQSVRKAQEHLQKVIEQVTDACTHPPTALRGSTYESGGDWRQTRVCLLCGLYEQENGTGFKIFPGRESDVAALPLDRLRPYCKRRYSTSKSSW